MDYYSIIVLVIITFIFISDRKIKKVEDIKNQNNNNFNENLKEVRDNLLVLKLNFDNITKNELYNLIRNKKNKYLLLENSLLNLNAKQIDTLIANFINSDKKICGFNIKYTYKKNKKSFFKKIYVSLINYLNIFNKNDITTYGVIILDLKDINKIKFIKNKKVICNNIISYVQNKKINLNADISNINIKKYTLMCFKKIYNANLKFILKFTLLFITGTYITTNLIISITSIKINITNFFVSLAIYFCYSYILKYIYEPVGKEKIIASYFFPLYFIAYFYIILFINLFKKNKFNFT